MQIISPLIVSFIVSAITTPLIIRFAPILGIIDNPLKRKGPATLHKKPIPRGGGIPIFLAIFITSLIFLQITQRTLAILAGAFIITSIGFLDDQKDINPYFRLLGQFIASLIVAGSGIGIAFISNPLSAGKVIDLSNPKIFFQINGQTHSLWIISATFAIIWLIAIMNSVSWSSGVDGQLSGFVSLAALTILFLSLRFQNDLSQKPVIILSAATAGAYLGFLPYHIYPQKIMPGFGGGTLAGYMLAVLSILSTTKVGTLLMVLAIPVADAAYAILRRIKSGKSPVWGDRKHFHHRLLDAGWSIPKIATFYWITTAFLGFLAINLNSQAKFYTMIGIALSIGGILLWLSSLLQSSNRQDQNNGSKI